MSNRYTNLVGVNKIKDEFTKINTGFDTVQTEMDARIATEASLQTQITTEQQARIAADEAHAASTTAHAAQNITYSGAVAGATTVKGAIDSEKARVDGIVGQTGSSNTEIVDARQGSDGTAHAVLKNRLDKIELRQIVAAVQSAAIKHGWNYILADQSSPLNVTVFGRTLVNLLGKDGNCESLTPFISAGTMPALSTTQKKSGSNSIKFMSSSSNGYLHKSYPYKLDISKYHILAAWVYIESFTSGAIDFALYDFNGAGPSRYSGVISTSTIGSWQLVYINVPTSNTIVGDGFTLLFGCGPTGTRTVYFDDIRLYELSAADYNAIGTTYTATTTPSIDDFIPYVDSVKHLSGVGVSKIGKNMLSEIPDLINANAVINQPYKLTLVAPSASAVGSYFTVRALPSQTYYFSCVHDSRVLIICRDINGTELSRPFNYTTLQGGSFTTTATTYNIEYYLTNLTAGTFTFSNWQLELGSVATAFEARNDDYAYAPVQLGSNLDGSVRDSYDFTSKMITRRWQKGVVLDGSLAWVFGVDYTGYKTVTIPLSSFPGIISNSTALTTTKYNGAPLRSVTGATAADQIYTGASNMALSIADIDSGWTETLNPNNNASKALANGWKANGNNGTVYTSWVAVLDGVTVPGTNTEAFVAANKAPGWTGWVTLDYQLAISVEEPVIGAEGSIGLHSGGNQVELFEGLAPLREKANPQFLSPNYHINNTTVPTSQLKNRVLKILAVYKNGVRDNKWLINSTNAYGNEKPYIAQSDYDTTAEYTVTYIDLDKYLSTVNAIDCTATYNTNLKTVVDSVVQHMADAETQISVLTNALAAQPKRQVGSATGTIVTPGTAVTVNVTFTRAYAIAPEIRLTLKSSAGGTAGYINLAAENITTTGFTLRVNAYVAGAIVAGWEAIG